MIVVATENFEVYHEVLALRSRGSDFTTIGADQPLPWDASVGIVGIDPRTEPGITVLTSDVVIAAFQVPIEDAAATILDEIGDATDPLIRLGDRARLHSARILEDLADDVPVELVVETGTTPHLETGPAG